MTNDILFSSPRYVNLFEENGRFCFDKVFFLFKVVNVFVFNPIKATFKQQNHGTSFF